jgi:kynureninase
MKLDLAAIRRLDRQDPLRGFREEFWIPKHGDGEPRLYFCGNSLGLQPRRLGAFMEQELAAWKALGVEGHFEGEHPWTRYHELLREPLAELAGALPSEVVAMNTLTVNLHLMMISFFRPRGRRNRVLIERQPFPSDRYAVESQLRLHGLDPAECLVELGSLQDGRIIDESLIEEYLEREGDRVALVFWPGVHYASGQWFDLERITRAAHAAGAIAGFDLAHAIGNVPLALHDNGADFAAWCTYKYLNAGPGSVAGCYVHQRHHDHAGLPRLHGWWGCDPETRFLMHPAFHPAPGADAWQLSNPPILAMAPLRAALELFREAGMQRLRDKSIALTGALEQLIRQNLDAVFEIITPGEPQRRGCQLSLRIRSGRADGRALFERLLESGVVTDWREPDVIRVAPVPLYNSFEDCWQFVENVRRICP